MQERYEQVTPDLTERMRKELDVIKKMGFASYFLIVADFISYARSQDIPVGPGRGSAAGSLVAYVLRITNLDPIRYHLLFERFLNVDRVSMPDFDIDFCNDRREEVITYVKEKYGYKNVARSSLSAQWRARGYTRCGPSVKNTVWRCGQDCQAGAYSAQGQAGRCPDKVPELKELEGKSPVYQKLIKML